MSTGGGPFDLPRFASGAERGRLGHTAAEWRAIAAQNYPSPGFEGAWSRSWYRYSDLIADAEANERAEAETQRLVASQRGLIGDDGAA